MWGIGGGMPDGFAELLRRKYDIMQQGADTQEMGVRADANLTNVRAGLMPAQSAADIAKSKADTAGILETNKFIAGDARARIGLMGAQAYGARTGGTLNLSQAGNVDAEAVGNRQLNRINPYTRLGLSQSGTETADDLRRGVRFGLSDYPLLRN